MMWFASNLKNGDFRNWIGRANAAWLEKNGHADMLARAESEFNSIARQFTEPLPGQWQSLFFPMAVGGELQQARLFVKRDRKDKEEQGKRKKEDDTRFVVEMELTQLGQMQLDGFVRRREEAISFDLVVRSHHPLDKVDEQEISRIYNDSAAITGFQGSLSFQTVKEFPVNPMEEINREATKGIVA